MRRRNKTKSFLMALGIVIYLFGVPLSICFWFGTQAHSFALAIMCFSCTVAVGSFCLCCAALLEFPGDGEKKE